MPASCRVGANFPWCVRCLRVRERARQRSQTLLLAQQKWLTAPAEPREVRKADEELKRGIEQAYASKAFIERHLAGAAEVLFPALGVQIGPASRIRLAVICRNHVGSADILDPNVPILDYMLTGQCLREEAGGRTLDRIYGDLTRLLIRARRGTDYEVGTVSISLAGYTFTTEGVTLLVPSLARLGSVFAEQPSEVGRNDPCPCGSGKKYKYCHGRQ